MILTVTRLSPVLSQRLEVIILAVVVCALIFELVRREHLMERYAILWLLAGATVLVLGLWSGAAEPRPQPHHSSRVRAGNATGERARADTWSSGIGFSRETTLSLRNGSPRPAISAERRPSSTRAGGNGIARRRRPCAQAISS